MLKNNFIKKKLENGEKVLGTWIVIPSVSAVDIICSAGLDFVIIDREHGPISFETAQEMVIACESRSVSPLIRIGSIDEAEILKGLDIGAHGIQIPNIKNVNEVTDIIKFSKFPPIGSRGFSPFTRSGNYSMKNSTKLINEANQNVLTGINIEGKEAIDNIDKILSVEHLDLIFIGLFDLSKSLGLAGQVNHKKVLDMLELIVKKTIDAGKYPGTIATSDENMKKFIELDLRFILYMVDCEMIQSSYVKIKNEFRRSL